MTWEDQRLPSNNSTRRRNWMCGMFWVAFVLGLVVWFGSSRSRPLNSSKQDKSTPTVESADDLVESIQTMPPKAAPSLSLTSTEPTTLAAESHHQSSDQPSTLQSSYCAATHNCLTDRLGNNRFPIQQGQGLCNHQFYFGWSTDGSLIWRDCQRDETKVIFDGSSFSLVGNNHSFLLLEDASFNIYKKDQLIWTKHSLRRIKLHPKCLGKPELDCPYLHLHKNGDLVLNSIEEHKWKARLSQDAFFDLFESSTKPNPKAHSDNTYCDRVQHCLLDRLGNGKNFRLGVGKAICRENFMFGFTTMGVFQWKNCDTNETRVMFDGSHGGGMYPDMFFELKENASLNIYNGDELLWQRNCTQKVSLTRECLNDPLLDCPYLVLHRGGGDVVLNFVDDNTTDWVDRKIKRVYHNLYK